jgi:ribosome-binding factor A
MDTRRIPEISFVLDEGYKREARIEELLNENKKGTK